jgi:hypothetical protein
MRLKFELEYTLNCSPKVLFSRLSTPEGLGEWFAEQVNVDGDLFSGIILKPKQGYRPLKRISWSDLSGMKWKMKKPTILNSGLM